MSQSATAASAPLLDVAIIGAGLCGLRLADLLRPSGAHIAVFEARARIGGRVLTVDGDLDLGPTWFWPVTQPRITRLVAELGLPSFAQHDDGQVLLLNDPDRAPQMMVMPELHGGAQRITGGMTRLTQALAQRLPVGILHLNHQLLAAVRRADHIELELQHGNIRLTLRTRQLVLALPPRLIEACIRFTPELPAPLRTALRATPTWMACTEKVAMRYAQPFWRDDGYSGNAFIQYPQAVLYEVFDACDAYTGSAALAGFVDLNPTQRRIFRSGLPLMLRSQFAQLFGPRAEQGELHSYDWAEDGLTCSVLDRNEVLTMHPDYGDARLSVPQWDGRLLIGGSESADSGGGYLEGALAAAARIAAQLQTAPVQLGESNEHRLALFRDWVQAERAGVFAHYRQALHRRLSSQNSAALTQQALLETVEALYERALAELARLRFEAQQLAIENGRSILAPLLLVPFVGFNDALLEAVIAFNRGSCALSNFPFEHAPDDAYVEVIRRDLTVAWQAFARAVDAQLLPAVSAVASAGD